MIIHPNLVLRPLTASDAPELFKLVEANRARLREWLPWLDANTKLADTSQFIETSRIAMERRESMTMGILLHGKIAGVISFHQFDWTKLEAGFGYWVGAEFQGQGLVTSSCRILVDYAFNELGLKTVSISCAVNNHRSCAVAERLGFVKDRIVLNKEWLNDHHVDHVVYVKQKE